MSRIQQDVLQLIFLIIFGKGWLTSLRPRNIAFIFKILQFLKKYIKKFPKRNKSTRSRNSVGRAAHKEEEGRVRVCLIYYLELRCGRRQNCESAARARAARSTGDGIGGRSMSDKPPPRRTCAPLRPLRRRADRKAKIANTVLNRIDRRWRQSGQRHRSIGRRCTGRSPTHNHCRAADWTGEGTQRAVMCRW